MPIAKYDALKNLVISLSKAEKRHFMLYVKRLDSNKDVLFLKLFELIDKHKGIEQVQLQNKLGLKSKAQFVNAKRHLYSQILKSLRIQLVDSDLSLKIRQTLDYASILYGKGLYSESLAILDKALPLANQINDNLLALEVEELKKKIESRHITRSRRKADSIELLIHNSKKRKDLIAIETEMSNISIQIQGLYIKWGFVKEEKDTLLCKIYFENQLPSFSEVNKSAFASVLWHQSQVWYRYMNLQFLYSYKHAIQWVQRMDRNQSLIEYDPDLYMRGLHYIMTNCFYLNNIEKYNKWFAYYQQFRSKYYSSYNANSKFIDFNYYNNAILNHRIINNNLGGFDTFAKSLISELAGTGDKIDTHRHLIFFYKIAMIYSYLGNYEKAISYLNKVIDNKDQHLRDDIFNYARLIQLMCHYRLNNFALVQNLIPSVKQGFKNARLYNSGIELLVHFLRKGSKEMNFGIKELVNQLTTELELLKKDKYIKAIFLYYDFINWAKTLNENISIEKLRRE